MMGTGFAFGSCVVQEEDSKCTFGLKPGGRVVALFIVCEWEALLWCALFFGFSMAVVAAILGI